MPNITGIVGVNTYSGFDMLSLMVIVLAAIAIIGTLALLGGNYAKYKRLMGIFGFLGKVCIYFGKGLLGVAAFGSLYFLVDILNQSVKSGVIRLDIIAMWLGIAVGSFFGIAGFGYVLDRIWKRLKVQRKRYKKEKEPKP